MLNAFSGGAAQNVSALSVGAPEVLAWCQEFAGRRMKKRREQVGLVLKTNADPRTSVAPPPPTLPCPRALLAIDAGNLPVHVCVTRVASLQSV